MLQKQLPTKVQEIMDVTVWLLRAHTCVFVFVTNLSLGYNEIR